MARTEDDTWDLASSVGATATMVAASRAMASRTEHALINDPFALPLVCAVGVDLFTRLAGGVPGGRVDDEDLARAGGDQALAFRVAAARELVEEANVRVDAADPILIAHWITPEIEIRRFDTRFFLVRMPDGQEARHDAGETTDLLWLSPSEAIERCLRGEIMLPPPTWTTLKRMQRHRSLDELFEWAGSVAIIPPVQPRLFKDAQEQTVLTLPGDSTYPTIEGWEVPEETRFVLREGRWLPVSPS